MKRIIFLGTPEISANVLNKLINLKNSKIVAVISQPDKMINRKKEIVYNPVKKFCLEHNLNLLQPLKISEITEKIRELKPDILITCAYGQFIPQTIIDIPTIGIFNLHASILPKLRGGAPIHYAIINGFKKTGVTLMETTLKMDAGNIIDTIECNIDKNETTKSLTTKLANLACIILEKNWEKLINNNYTTKPQNEDEVTFAYNIKKDQTILNFNDSCLNLDNKIRGLFDKPMAIWIYKNINIKIWEAIQTDIKSKSIPGTINKIDKSGIYISTKDYDLLITKIQLPNKNSVDIKNLINGNNIFQKN